MNPYDLDKLKTTAGPQDPAYADVITRCDCCDGEIYEGEEVYLIDGGYVIHIDCWNEFAKELLRPVSRNISEIPELRGL